jgi:hypothetical protein
MGFSRGRLFGLPAGCSSWRVGLQGQIVSVGSSSGVLRCGAREEVVSRDEAMDPGQAAPKSPSSSGPSGGIRRTGLAFRAIFILILLVVTVRVASPQVETIWTAFETPSDVVRMTLGLFVCLWLIIHLFTAPKDPDAFRTWFYLGLVLLPLALICAAVIW